MLFFFCIFSFSFSYWTPKVGNSFNIQLQGTINTSIPVDIFDIDLFDTPISTINELHSKGKRVICYFSTQYENWRTDAGDFSIETLGKNLDGWPGEKWVDITNDSIKVIMENRIKLAQEKGCDAVDPDNVDEYLQDSGFTLTYNDQIAFNTFLSSTAHSYNLGVGLKNDGSQTDDLEEYFDFSIVEQCFKYTECDIYCPFVGNGKPVFEIEYVSEGLDPNNYCPDANNMGLTTVQKTFDLFAPIATSCLSEFDHPSCEYTCGAYNYTCGTNLASTSMTISSILISLLLFFF